MKTEKTILDHISISLFKATDHPDLCHEFIDGHESVLREIGVKKVTSAKSTWTKNPYCHVLVAKSIQTNKIIGGARIDIKGDDQDLPIEEAVGYIDEKIYSRVKEVKLMEAAELCGLWTSLAVSGRGTAVLLIRSAISILIQLKVSRLFVLCAESTFQMFGNIGCSIMTDLGDNGKFYYPKLDLIATALQVTDCKGIPYATKIDQCKIFDLRNSPNQMKVIEQGPKGPIMVDYFLKNSD